jgi:hypothetical protein
MRKIVFLLILTASLSSCKSYFLSTINSPDLKQSGPAGIFNSENDSLKISYNFSGDNSPLNVEIYNKLNEPVYVNWERSSLIVGDKAYSFFNNNMKIVGQTSGSSTTFRKTGNTYMDGNLSATVRQSKSEDFIPPNAKVSRSLYVLADIKIDKIQDSTFKRIGLNYSDGTPGVVYAKEVRFSEADSPLKFRTYLTLSTLKNNSPVLFSYQHNFFVSSITKSFVNPNNLLEYTNNPGNVMVSTKMTGYGKTLTGIALVSTLGGLAAADAALTDSNKKNK